MISVMDMTGEVKTYEEYDRLGSTPAGVLTLSTDDKHGVLIAAGQWAFAKIDVDVVADAPEEQEDEGEDG